MNFKGACIKCVGRLFHGPLAYYRVLKRMDLFIIGNVPAESIPLGNRFTLDRCAGLAVSGVFWAVDVKGWVREAVLTTVREAVLKLNCIVLEEVCHYLGWRHSERAGHHR